MLLQAMASSTVDHHLTPPQSEPTSLASVAPVESLEALSSSLPPETPRPHHLLYPGWGTSKPSSQ